MEVLNIMRVIKITVQEDDESIKELNVLDGTALLICENDQVFTQVTSRGDINLELIKKIMK